MPLTSYCKKCGMDVPVGEFCPQCHGKLAGNAVRLAWCVEHAPWRDWLCWNGMMRIVLPSCGALIVLLAVMELIFGGLASMFTMLGGLTVGLAVLLGLLIAVMLLVLILQGDDLLDCVMDAKGIHVTTYLPRPTKMKLLLRGKSPQMLLDAPEDGMLSVHQREIAWKDVQRVQLWPGKPVLLIYAPAWWMRVGLPCTAATWTDAIDLIAEKIGRRKDVILPAVCQRDEPKSPAKTRKPRKTQQLSIDDIPAENAPTDPSTGE